MSTKDELMKELKWLAECVAGAIIMGDYRALPQALVNVRKIIDSIEQEEGKGG